MKHITASFGGYFEEVAVYRSRERWSDWFSEGGWHNTWIGVDKKERRVWALMITDND